MNLNDYESILGHIRKHFRPLFEKNAKVIYSDWPPKSFDNFAITLELIDFRIRFTRDRSMIAVEIGTLQAEPDWHKDEGGLWYDLIDIVMFLTQKQLLITGYWDFKFNTDKQLELLAKVFFYFYDQIIELYKPENFQKDREKLHLVYEDGLSLTFDFQRKEELKSLEVKSQEFWKTV
jgi:hypothetical protein